jgi:hypothetical protein
MGESPENGCSRLFFIAIWLNLTRMCDVINRIEGADFQMVFLAVVV